MNSFFKWQKQKKTAYLHQVIHYNTEKTVYNMITKINTQAAAQIYSEKTCKFRAKLGEL